MDETPENVANDNGGTKARPSLSPAAQKALAQRLHDAWKATGMTRLKLAELADIDATYLGRMIKGDRVGAVSLATLIRFAEACKQDPATLIFGSPAFVRISRKDLDEDWDYLVVSPGGGHAALKTSDPAKAKRPAKRKQ